MAERFFIINNENDVINVIVWIEVVINLVIETVAIVSLDIRAVISIKVIVVDGEQNVT